MLSPETITEFKEAIKQDYGKDVTIEEASVILRDLIDYFYTLGSVYSRMKIETEFDTILRPD